ncbi:cilia- and flagella-associated protein 45 [Sapajus apella]|uniref:Cilia- and flagella-associated protein 45 n=1 Tax=Sapajus apella TaxID=9515 RepID=A0A6J3GFP4_SAPAP|nr:cilia- and flagella-associated protein 45 [Sapajus apella]
MGWRIVDCPRSGCHSVLMTQTFCLFLQPLSTAGVLSSSSTASSRSRNKNRYRTKAVSSEVDENLFGDIKSPAQGQSDSPIVLLRDKHTLRKSLTAVALDRKPETIQLITRDMVRELIVPTEDPSGESLIISPEEFERIKWGSHVLTREELEARDQAFKKEKEAIMDAVVTRKKIMKQKEMVWNNNKKLSDLEEVAKERAQNLLQRANKLRMEQEEELKDMSKIILNAKCHAIRDAQILEKQQIQKELDTEEKRLDQMMEVERQKSIQRQEELDRKRREERIRGRRQIVEQMEKNQEERSLLAEQREQEKEQMLEYMEQLQEEDLKVTGQTDDATFHQQQQHQNPSGLWAFRVSLSYKRGAGAQGSVVCEACVLEEPTREAPPPPFLAWASSAEFILFLFPSPRAQREQIEKERLEEEKKATGRLQHANELRRQVRENQQKQVQNRIATFEEGRRLKEEAQKRREHIDDIKRKKLEELRATGLPEKYCIEAERKANILPATSVN